MSGIENADYETMTDCARWAVENDYLPTYGHRVAEALEIIRFIEGNPRNALEAADFRLLFNMWQEETR